jgi:peptide/nickel transport system substrate-binding protein
VPACMRRPAHCDLSRGIESDPATGTVTVHLTARDPELLDKLTMPFAYVVPPGTPARRSMNLAPPGTGPYRIAAWDSGRGGRLVRNPRFRPTANRPAGLADRIDFKASTRGEGGARGIAAVERGTTDVLLLSPPLPRVINPGRVKALVASAPGQVHSVPTAGTTWMFLNVRRAPFDDIRVRRAVNLTTDRAALVDLAGGLELASPSCTIIPAAFPGYEPGCAYTANRSHGRGWTAPDLERARRLIAASGTAGESVVVDVPAPQRDRLGRYFVSLLRELGFHARLRSLPIEPYFTRILAPGSRDQMGFVGWGADFISPSGIIDGNFTCTPRQDPVDGNPSHLCDGGVTRAVARARTTTGAGSAPAWAAADRRLVDLAPAVPTTNDRTLIFVSKRVGNVTHHSQWVTLLDQMWVR